jgi:hypothetical protein
MPVSSTLDAGPTLSPGPATRLCIDSRASHGHYSFAPSANHRLQSRTLREPDRDGARPPEALRRRKSWRHVLQAHSLRGFLSRDHWQAGPAGGKCQTQGRKACLQPREGRSVTQTLQPARLRPRPSSLLIRRHPGVIGQASSNRVKTLATRAFPEFFSATSGAPGRNLQDGAWPVPDQSRRGGRSTH